MKNSNRRMDIRKLPEDARQQKCAGELTSELIAESFCE